MADHDLLERFAAAVRSPDPAVRLDEAALVIAAHAQPDLDVDGELAALDELAAGCRVPTLDGLRRHLFTDLGFGGNRDDYYDPRNSYLNCVRVRRTGIPITLSVLMMEVGRRIGVPLSGVGMPGHFLVRDKVDPDVFVDPFERGAVLDAGGCERRFRLVHGPGAGFDPAYLEPAPRRDIVVRMLANLETIFLDGSDQGSLTWVARLRAAVPGAADVELRKLAALLAAGGAYDTAADELERLAGVLDGADAARARRQALALRSKLN